MSLIYINTMLALTISLTGMLMYRSHLMSLLLCLEGMMLSLFMMITITILSNQFTLANMVPIILLVLAACEAALGLSLFASTCI